MFEAIFGTNTAAFSTTDILGDLIVAWYPFLNAKSKRLAFKRLVSTAVNYNRCKVMHQTRWFYHEERVELIIKELLQILEQEDPTKAIEGRGMIPERA